MQNYKKIITLSTIKAWCYGSLVIKQSGELDQPSGIYSFVPLAFVAAVGGVGFEDVAVSGFQLFKDTALVYHSGPAIIGETA